MREPLRHVERAAVVLVQLDGDALQVGRALGPQVDDDVDDRAARAADDLRLRLRRKLEVHAAQRARDVVEGDVRLRDHGLQAVVGELVLAERAREEAARVLAPLEVDHEGAGSAVSVKITCSTPSAQARTDPDLRPPPQLVVEPARAR